MPVEVNEAGLVFCGTAGFIRERESGQHELALFHGTRIGDDRFEIRTTNPDAGISTVLSNDLSVNGQYSCVGSSEVIFKWNRVIPKEMRFYLDGARQLIKATEETIVVNIPAGKHIWNLTVGLPHLSRPEIDYTRNEVGKVLFAAHPVAGATSYRFDYSTDIGNTWTKLKEQTKDQLLLRALKNEAKGYVRVVALNKEHESQASVIYPVYFTSEKPHYPDGLKLNIGAGKINLTWGKVLGCAEFKLYRRVKGSEKFQVIYHGKESWFNDCSLQPKEIYEYTVTAINGNGESELSNMVNNNPSGWMNFNPMPGEPFRRSVNLYDGSRDNSGNPVDLYYPK